MAPDRLRRVLAALFLGVLSLAWGADAVHRAWTPHVRCAVDGEVAHADHVEHAGHREHGDHGDHDVAKPADRLDGGVEVDAGDDEPGHDHCGLPELGRASTLDLARPHLATPPCVALRPVLTPGAEAHASVALLFLAPKQSPPRAV